MTSCHDGYTTAELRPAASDTLARHRVVVGVDGSAESLTALRWAANQAFLSGARLQIVNVYEPVAEISFAFGGYPAVNPVDPAMAKQSALAALEGYVHRVLPDDDEDQVELVTLADGAPSKALTQLATDADMLVLGAHHRHGLGLLLGSTAASCVRHAECPVVVVPTRTGHAG
jgi:nucleotide-binding universal stress UspA family protein